MEDDATSRDLLARLLTRLGYVVQTAGTVGEALAELNRHTHVILDLMLPDGFGTAVLQRARSGPRRIKIAIMTGASADAGHYREAMSLSPDAVFRKPIELSELLHWLNQPG